MMKAGFLALCAALIGASMADYQYGAKYIKKYGNYRHRPHQDLYKKANGGWSEWGHYSDCSVTCGGGYQYKTRTCTNPAPAYGGDNCYGEDKHQVECNTHHCKVPGGWSEWGHYSECSAKCGGGYQYKTRTCTNPAPAYGGDNCYGEEKYQVECNTHYCKVHGGWSEWAHSSECSAKCGGGYKYKTRTCTNPAPAYGGDNCYGEEKEEVECNTHYCKVHGGWSEWTHFSECSAKCGGGYKYKTRTCTNPAPAYGGDNCYGDDEEKVECNTHYCKVDGEWTEWGHYSECSAKCGGGYKYKTRTCTNPAPAYGGHSCYGDDKHLVECNTHHCKVDGEWSEWGHYSVCSAKCGGGYKYKTRTCTNPAPAYGGHSCYGDEKEEVECNTHYCKVHGGWSEWAHSFECSAKCGGGYKYKTRTCTNPAPAYGGDNCYGEEKEEVKCNTHYCKVHGGWSEWAHSSECSAKCGGGYKYKTRTCTNPAPAYGGDNCYGDDKEEVKCNTHYCKVHGGWSEWAHISECSAKCGGGYKYKTRTCTNPAPAYGGDNCYGGDKLKVKCNAHKCKVDGGWAHWSSWSACSGSCGSGVQTRSRSCTYPAPAYGGKDCYGEKEQTKACYHTKKCYGYGY